MRKIVAVSAFLALLCVSVVSADLVRPRKMDADEKIGPMTERFYVVDYKGNAPGKIIVSGDYRSCLGLYVYDAAGNCVAHDDKTSPQASDDLNVDWIPTATGRYLVAIRNAGFDVNTYNLAIR